MPSQASSVVYLKQVYFPELLNKVLGEVFLQWPFYTRSYGAPIVVSAGGGLH